MKKSVLLLWACLLFSGVASAQDFLKNSPLRNTFNAKDVRQAIEGMKDFYKVERGAVSFILVIDSLPHDAAAIHDFAAEYLTESYRITKYEVVQENAEKGFIVGQGEFNAFESYAAFPNQYTFTCNPSLRIDAKDGRARVCISVGEYHQIRTNGNIKEDKDVKLTDVPPVNVNTDISEKMYNKVFLALARKALDVCDEFEAFVRSKQSDDIGDW